MPSAVGRLRLANLALRAEMLDHIHRSGFEDISHGQYPIFRFAGPDGRKPTEIAATAGMSKQSVNDALGHLERAGYLERTPHPHDGRARVVRLTDKGRRLDAAIWEAGREVERVWRERIGKDRWSTFYEVLDELADVRAEDVEQTDVS